MVYKKQVYPTSDSQGNRGIPSQNSIEPQLTRAETGEVPKKEDTLYRTDHKEFDDYDKKIFSSLNSTQNMLRLMAIMHENAKNNYHAKGLQGFKRFHRYYAREYYELSMEIQSAMIDYYHIMPVIEVDVPRDYGKRELRDLVYHNHDKLEMMEGRLSSLINEVVLLPDSHATCYLKKALELVRCEHKYVDRDKHYFIDVEWDKCAIHLYSENLHKTYKKLECDIHNRKPGE